MRKTIKIITILILGIMLIYSNNVYAASDSYNVGLDINKSTILQGETLEIVVSLKDLNITTGDKGLGAYQGTLEYDSTIFEYVGIKGLNSWDTPIYNNGTFATTTSTGEVIKKSEEVAKITLKAKTNLTQGETTISVKNITASTGTSTVSTGNISKKIVVQGTQKGNTSGQNVSNTNTTSSSSTKSNSSNATKDKTTTKKIIPKTGINNIIVVTIIATMGVLVITLTGLIVYIRKSK